MSLNGKRDNFNLTDLLEFGEFCEISARSAKQIIEQIQAVVANWMDYSNKSDISKEVEIAIDGQLRKKLLG